MSKALFNPYELMPLPYIPITIYTKHGEEDFGVARANSRTHKHYLRQHHLGKFKKKRTK